MGNGFVFIGRCVTRAVKAIGHTMWLGFQTQGYYMAMGYLPSEDTEDLVNPLVREYEKDHA